MDEKQSKKIRDYIFDSTWTQHDISGCAGYKEREARLIDLPLEKADGKEILSEEERKEALRIINEDLGIRADIRVSVSMGCIYVLRIEGQDNIDKTQQLNPPFKRISRPGREPAACSAHPEI
ncbi:MAG: hypothetical protein WC464_03065 [Bdellovibrionales bacterium]